MCNEFEPLCFLAPDVFLSWGLVPRVGMLSSSWTLCIFKVGANKASKTPASSENQILQKLFKKHIFLSLGK